MVYFIVANLGLEEVKKEKRKMISMMKRMVARFVTDFFALLADSFAFYFSCLIYRLSLKHQE